MKYVKYVLTLVVLIMIAGVVTVSAPKVHAEALGLQCNYTGEDGVEINDTEGCDLALTKDVDVNGNAYVSAETTSLAPQAHVGDTIGWQITVTNNSSEDLAPTGSVTVNDTLPAGVTYVSYTASTGTYADGVWTFILDGNLPATLTIITTANATGLSENVANLATYDEYNCDWEYQYSVPYSDADPSNNSDNAYVNVVAVTPAPVTPAPAPVAPTPKAPNTGFGISASDPFQALPIYIVGASTFLALAFTVRQRSTKTN